MRLHRTRSQRGITNGQDWWTEINGRRWNVECITNKVGGRRCYWVIPEGWEKGEPIFFASGLAEARKHLEEMS